MLKCRIALIRRNKIDSCQIKYFIEGTFIEVKFSEFHQIFLIVFLEGQFLQKSNKSVAFLYNYPSTNGF